MRLLKARKLCFCKYLPIAFPSVSIYKTCSHCFWSEYNLSKHVPVAKYWFVSLLTAWIINANVWCYVLIFLRGPQVSKRAEIDQKKYFLCDEALAFVENTFPLLLAWLQFVKTCSRRFCHFFAMGTCFDKLKMQEILEKSLWKHGLIAKTAQKRP